jgi:hypothetical protein
MSEDGDWYADVEKPYHPERLFAVEPLYASPSTPNQDGLADLICRDVAELPDRNSPADWPEAMLVTRDELRSIVLAALQGERHGD